MIATPKIDLFKLHKLEYATPKEPVLVAIPAASYLAISGQGAPGGAEFQEKIGALLGAAFTLKMARKFSGGQDYAVCKLEGQFWTGADAADFVHVPKTEWSWRLLIRTPEFVTQDELAKAISTLLKKGKAPAIAEVRLDSIAEGRCVQMLHVGPYDREPESIERMRQFASANHLAFRGRHHEIYLSDPRRVLPERLKTILRIPVTPKG